MIFHELYNKTDNDNNIPLKVHSNLTTRIIEVT